MVVLGSDGSIQQGPVDQVLVKAAATIAEEQPTEKPAVFTSHESAPKIAITEEVAEGHVQWPACAKKSLAVYSASILTPFLVKLYLSSLSSYPLLFWIVFGGGIALNEITLVIQVWFLGYWSAQYEHQLPSEVSSS
jgi:hypothetical protein